MRPLAYVLRACLRAPIFEFDIADASTGLERLTAGHKVFVIPVNEVALNHIGGLLDGHPSMADRLVMPGTAYLDGRTILPVELSDKGALYRLMGGLEFHRFKPVASALFAPEDSRAFAQLVQSFPLPVVIKPAIKDNEDGFTRLFPGKLLAISAVEQVGEVFERLRRHFPRSVFIIQAAIRGESVSWFGAAKEGKILCGHGILAEAKSPASSHGGTTTLARIAPATSDLEDAARELAETLRLDGFFEIEFIRNRDGLYFFHEINPRPILQASLIVSQEMNPFIDYFLEQGVERLASNPLTPATLWGSALRYLRLNRDTRLNWRMLLNHLVHDTRFGPYHALTEKLRYMGSVVSHLLGRIL